MHCVFFVLPTTIKWNLLGIMHHVCLLHPLFLLLSFSRANNLDYLLYCVITHLYKMENVLNWMLYVTPTTVTVARNVALCHGPKKEIVDRLNVVWVWCIWNTDCCPAQQFHVLSAPVHLIKLQKGSVISRYVRAGKAENCAGLWVYRNTGARTTNLRNI